jgi:hypothetical protein
MLNNRFGRWSWSGLAMMATLVIFGATAQLAAAKVGDLLSKAELKALVAKAETPADHMKLSRHYSAKAEQLEAEAKEHEELAKEYKGHVTVHGLKHPMSGQTAEHCELFAQQFAKAAKEARAMAAAHENMAKHEHK